MKKLLALLLAALLLASCAASVCAEAQPLTDEAAAWWNGLWYGWRVVTAASGSFAEQQNQRADIVGTIETMNEHGVIVLWDYDAYPECAFLMTLGSFHFDETGLGRFYSESGFAFNGSLTQKSLSGRAVWEFEHMLRLQGSIVDPENAGNWLRFEIWMRPWGTDWEDIKASDDEALPYVDMLPAHYEDWYLEQLSLGLTPLDNDE